MIDSTHHIFAQEERDDYHVHIKENKVKMERKKHDALHVLFDNDHPKEQFLKLLELNKSVIADDIVVILQEILDLPKEEFYIPEIFNRKFQRKNREK